MAGLKLLSRDDIKLAIRDDVFGDFDVGLVIGGNVIAIIRSSRVLVRC